MNKGTPNNESSPSAGPHDFTVSQFRSVQDLFVHMVQPVQVSTQTGIYPELQSRVHQNTTPNTLRGLQMNQAKQIPEQASRSGNQALQSAVEGLGDVNSPQYHRHQSPQQQQRSQQLPQPHRPPTQHSPILQSQQQTTWQQSNQTMHSQNNSATDLFAENDDEHGLDNDHTLSHTDKGGTSFKCQFCAQTFLNRLLLQEHENQHGHVGEKPNKITCEVCGELFIDDLSFNEHKSLCLPPRRSQTESVETEIQEEIVDKAKKEGSYEDDPDATDCEVDSPPVKRVGRPRKTLNTLKPKPNTHKCNVCNKTFRRPYRLKEHLQTHTGEKPFHCQECKKSFKHQKSLISHMKIHDQPESVDVQTDFVCTHAYLVKEGTSRTKVYRCMRCNESFTVQLTPCHKPAQDFVIETTGTLENLEENDDNDDDVSFYLDDGDKMDDSRLIDSPKQKRVEKPFKCDICKKSFKLAIYLREHYQTHNGKTPYKCNLCDKEFSVKNALSAHRKTHMLPNTKQLVQNVPKKTRTCELCGKVCTNNWHLKIHMRKHTGERPYQCEVCGKGYITSSELRVHKYVHTGNKPFSCEVCGKRVVTSFALQTHMRVHTGERPFICEKCGAAFASKNNLEKHKAKHSDARPFKCDVCGKGFKSGTNFSVHRRLHTGEKPYRCRYCDYKCNQSQDLKRHEERHMGTTFSCECGASFKSSRKFREHRNKHGACAPTSNLGMMMAGLYNPPDDAFDRQLKLLGENPRNQMSLLS